MPKLWNETIEAHRRNVQDAILETTVALVAAHGLASVTMTQIAEETGIGRATLYKYFADIDAILLAWHERQISGHLERLAEVRDEAEDAASSLEAVLRAYAHIQRERVQHHDGQPHGGPELAAVLHGGEQVAAAQRELDAMLQELLTEAATAGHVRDDVQPRELARYCFHALTAASQIPSDAATHRLVGLVLAGLRPGS